MARKKQRFLAGTRGELDIVGAKGSKLIGGKGQRYIDFNMGWCVGNFDWSHASVKDAIRDFDGPPYIYPGYHYRPWEELAEVLVRMAPGRLAKVYRATGGTEAVDIALQLAMAYTKRGKFISIEGVGIAYRNMWLSQQFSRGALSYHVSIFGQRHWISRRRHGARTSQTAFPERSLN